MKGVLAATLAVVGLLARAVVYQTHGSEQQQVRAQVESLAFHALHAAEGLQVVPKDPGDTYERYRALFNLRTFRREAAGLAGWAGVAFDPVGRVGSAPDLTYGAFSYETYIALSDALRRAEAQLKELGAHPGSLGRARVGAVLKAIDAAIVAAEKPRSATLLLYSASVEGEATRIPRYASGKVSFVDRATVEQARQGRLPDLSDPFRFAKVSLANLVPEPMRKGFNLTAEWVPGVRWVAQNGVSIEVFAPSTATEPSIILTVPGLGFYEIDAVMTEGILFVKSITLHGEVLGL